MNHPRLAMCLSVLLTLSGCSATHLGSLDDAGLTPSLDSGHVRLDRDGGSTMPPTDVGPNDAAVIAELDAADPDLDAGLDADVDAGVDAGVDADVDAGPPDAGTDAGVDAGPDGGVSCGTDVCVAPQICCIGGRGGMSSQSCMEASACMGVVAECDGPDDCAAGEACCGVRRPGGGGIECVPEASCRIGRLCNVDSDCTGRDTCCSVMGLSICSPFCP